MWAGTEQAGIERNLSLQREWYAFWYTAESPSLDDGFIRACSGHQLDSGYLRLGPKTGRLWAVCCAGVDHPNQGPTGPLAPGRGVLWGHGRPGGVAGKEVFPGTGVGIMCRSGKAVT